MTWEPDVAAREKYKLGQRKPFAAALAELRAYADSKTDKLGVAVKNTGFIIVWPTYTGTAADTFINAPRILVPANKNRISLVVAQVAVEPNAFPTLAATYSWGYPAMAPVAGVGRAYGVLVQGYCLLPTRAIHHLGTLGNGTISEDALWITLSKVANGGITGYSPGFVIAYEGTLALEAPRNRGKVAA